MWQEGINTASSTLVFCETKNASERISNDLDNYGCVSQPYHSELSNSHREEILEDLASKWLNCLVAVRALDEGVDLPEVDCGVIISGTSQKRQMIQRMGRVLRRKNDERGAVFIILFARNTTEDPTRNDPDDGHLSLVFKHAETFKEFDEQTISEGQLVDFVRNCSELGR